jgi:ABC-type multidrug transport system ATPase subunit/pSer/pThr/pTyr-binding forkhead associated (FHA) protein
MTSTASSIRVLALGRALTLGPSETLTIGRDPDNGLVLPDARVSRHHGRLSWSGGAWWLEDLASANGTFAGGYRIDRIPIDGEIRALLGHPEEGVPVDLEPVPSPLEGEGEGGGTGGAAADPLSEFGPVTATHQVSRGVTIGRAPDNQVVIGELTVSRHHAVLSGTPDGGYELVDLKSHNGTYVNGRRIERVRVRESDVVGIGTTNFRLRNGSLEEYARAGEVSFQSVGLTVWAGQAVLLSQISFKIPNRSFLAAVGPSGAGKSTLLGALAGFRPAQQGQVLYGGRNLYACYEEFRQRIGYVPQDDILHPQLTVRRALQYAAELRFPPDVSRGERERRIDEVMGELHLGERAGLRIDRLSGGQRKRVSIALELLTRPSLLFLDEPTSGLDPGLELELMQLLRELADGGRTVIVVTHSVQSLDLCDRVLFLAAGGKMAYFGPSQEALSFFEQISFAAVFSDLEGKRDFDFRKRFEESEAYLVYVREPVAQLEIGDADHSGLAADPPRHRWWRQLSTLTRRYLAVIASDRANTILILAQAPLLAVIVALAVDPDGFAVSRPDAMSAGLTAIFFLTVCVTYMGLGNSIREVVKELPIYARERMIGLSSTAYLTSKVIVLGSVTVAQAAVLVWVGALRQGGAGHGALLPDLRLELWVAISAAGLAAMGLGLLISAAVSRADKALTLLPLLLVPQLVLASADLRVQDKPVLNQLSYISSAQWGYAAAASTINLNQLVYDRAASLDPRVSPNADPDHASAALVAQLRHSTNIKIRVRWRHDRATWTADVGILLAFFLLELLLAGLALRRRDPALLSTAARQQRARFAPKVAAGTSDSGSIV